MFSILSVEREAGSQGGVLCCKTDTKLPMGDVSRQMA